MAHIQPSGEARPTSSGRVHPMVLADSFAHQNFRKQKTPDMPDSPPSAPEPDSGSRRCGSGGSSAGRESNKNVHT